MFNIFVLGFSEILGFVVANIALFGRNFWLLFLPFFLPYAFSLSLNCMLDG